MLFNSLTFGAFFALLLPIYWLLPSHRPRLVALLAASWIFYAAWYPSYLLLFLAVLWSNHAAAGFIARHLEDAPGRARRMLTAVIVADLANLAFFKYLDFLVRSVASVLGLVTDVEMPEPFGLFLPLGISFYTFQVIAYQVDLWRGATEHVRNPFKFALFISFFPQLVAGPILRASEFLPQLASSRRFDGRRFLHGLDLIAIGVIKKVLIADQLAPFVDTVYAEPSGASWVTTLLAVYAYSAQIYCDFSGYTDIGRGCAACLGYDLPRNFQAPYLAVNITTFWREWHITLSNWLRDYLYIPLGGNRRTVSRTYVNLLLTMMLGGLWHGASWNFAVWGTLHGLALALTRFFHERLGVAPDRPLLRGRAYRVLSIAVTFHFVTFAWIFFRAPDFHRAFGVIDRLLRPGGLSAWDLNQFGYGTVGLMAGGVAGAGIAHLVGQVLIARGTSSRATFAWLRPAAYASIVVAVTLLASRGAQQFIYFQF